MIRKVIISFIVSCFTISTYGQFNFEDIKGDWISTKNQIVSLNNWAHGPTNYLINRKGEELNLFLAIDANILSFQNHYFVDFEEAFVIDKYNFQLIKVTDSLLVLKPISDFAKSFFNTKKSIEFTKKGYVQASKFKFEKLWFEKKVSALKKYTIEINAEKEAISKEYKYRYQSNEEDEYVLDEKGFRKIEQDTVIKQTFQLSEKKYQKLIKKLAESRINELNQEVKYSCSHCQKKSLMVNYNDKIFEYKEFGKTPYILKDMISLLNSFM